MRGPIGDRVSAQTGREFSIGGDLDVDLSLTPRIRAQRVRFANAEWGSEPYMLDLEAVDFRIRLWPLLRGEIVIPEIAFSRPAIVLEKNSEGEANWDLDKDDKEGEFPRIGRLVVDEGVLTYRDPAIDTDVTAQVATDTADSKTQFSAEGKFKGAASLARGTAGSVFLLRDQTQPFPLSGQAQIGATRAKLDGSITGLATFAAADLNLDLAGKNLADLIPVFGITLPPSPPYNIAGRLTRQGEQWRLADFSGKVGDSDLAGNLTVAADQKAPRIHADVTSKVLDLDDLAGFVGAPPAAGAGETESKDQRKKAELEKAKKDGRCPRRNSAQNA